MRYLKTKRGQGGGTWLHPKLAVRFAQWLDPKFAVWCDMQINSLKLRKSQIPTTIGGWAMLDELQEDGLRFERIYLDGANREQTEYALDR